MDQPKLERLLRLMKMLTANTSLTVDEIADKLGISSRSVYRYIDTFREAGFVVKKTNNCPKLDKSSHYFKDISQLIHFTEEEAYILKSAIESIDENNLLKQNLKKKLYTIYDYNINNLKANHNKDYSVVKTFSASPICGAFLYQKNNSIPLKQKKGYPSFSFRIPFLKIFFKINVSYMEVTFLILLS